MSDDALADTNADEEETAAAARRLRWVIRTLIAATLAIVGAVLVYVLFEPVYEASAWIRIEETKPFLAFKPQDDLGRSQRFVATQVELIRSPLVLGPVVAQPEIAYLAELKGEEDPIGWLAEEIQVERVEESELHRISFVSPERDNAVLIVNAVTRAYFDLHYQDDAQRVQRVIELLNDEKELRSGEVQRLRKNVRVLTMQAKQKGPQAAVTPSDDTAMSRLADLQQQLATVEMEREILGAEADASLERLIQLPAEAYVQDWIVQGKLAFVEELRKLVNRKRLELFEAEIASGTENNEQLVNRLKGEIQKMEVGLAELYQELPAEIEKQIALAALRQQKQKLADIKSQLKSYEIREQLLRERCENELKNVMEAGTLASGDTLELEFMRAELTRCQEVFDRIAGRITMLRTEQRAPARVTLMSEATAPTEPVEGYPYRNMALAAVGGFSLPFILMGLCIGLARLKSRMKRQ